VTDIKIQPCGMRLHVVFGRLNQSAGQKMAASSLKMQVCTYQITWHDIDLKSVNH
jgi:hypothetical protein